MITEFKTTETRRASTNLQRLHAHVSKCTPLSFHHQQFRRLSCRLFVSDPHSLLSNSTQEALADLRPGSRHGTTSEPESGRRMFKAMDQIQHLPRKNKKTKQKNKTKTRRSKRNGVLPAAFRDIQAPLPRANSTAMMGTSLQHRRGFVGFGLSMIKTYQWHGRPSVREKCNYLQSSSASSGGGGVLTDPGGMHIARHLSCYSFTLKSTHDDK